MVSCDYVRHMHDTLTFNAFVPSMREVVMQQSILSQKVSVLLTPACCHRIHGILKGFTGELLQNQSCLQVY